MTLQFDESVKLQRDYVYRERDAIIEGRSQALDILQFAKEDIDLYLKRHPILEAHSLERYILDHITYDFQAFPEYLEVRNHKQVRAFLLEIIEAEIQRKKELLTTDYLQFERLAVLKAIDECWVEEVDYLQQLRIIAGARQVAQRNPVFEYHQEAYKGYQKMKEEIKRGILQNILLSDVSYTEKGEMQVYFA